MKVPNVDLADSEDVGCLGTTCSLSLFSLLGLRVSRLVLKSVLAASTVSVCCFGIPKVNCTLGLSLLLVFASDFFGIPKENVGVFVRLLLLVSDSDFLITFTNVLVSAGLAASCCFTGSIPNLNEMLGVTPKLNIFLSASLIVPGFASSQHTHFNASFSFLTRQLWHSHLAFCGLAVSCKFFCLVTRTFTSDLGPG